MTNIVEHYYKIKIFTHQIFYKATTITNNK